MVWPGFIGQNIETLNIPYVHIVKVAIAVME
jgi:hypothetical protein